MISFILLLLCSSFAKDATVFPYPAHQKTLDNGLTIVVVPMQTPDVAQVRTWMAVGSRDEVDVGRTGFAHFFEHLMFYGTKSLSRQDREHTIQQLGAEENAWTWFDDTVYHATLASNNVQKYIEIEGDRFQNLLLTDEMVRKEAGAVYGEYRKGQASPVNRLYETLYRTAFQVHPYHHDTIGSEADIAAMPTAHTYSSTFFDRHYRPQHAAVIVVGDVDPEQVFSWTEAAYGGWSQGKSTAPSVPKEPVQTEKREARLDWPTPTAPQLAMAWKAPGYDPDSATYVSLHLVSSLLMGEVGPLKRRLIREEGLAYSVQVELDAFVDPGLFKIVVELKDAAHVDAAEAIVRDEVSSLGQAIEAGWFDETRTRDRYQTLTSLDNPDSVSSQLGWAWRRTRSVDAIDRFFVTYSGLTPTGVSSVVQDMFTDRTLTRVVLMPPDEEGASQ